MILKKFKPKRLQKFTKIKIHFLEYCQDSSSFHVIDSISDSLLILTNYPQIARLRFSVELNPSYNDFDLM